MRLYIKIEIPEVGLKVLIIIIFGSWFLDEIAADGFDDLLSHDLTMEDGALGETRPGDVGYCEQLLGEPTYGVLTFVPRAIVTDMFISVNCEPSEEVSEGNTRAVQGPLLERTKKEPIQQLSDIGCDNEGPQEEPLVWEAL